MIRPALIAAAFALAGAAPAAAQQVQGNAAITIEQALNVSAIRPLVFSAEEGDTVSALDESPAVIEITGDPGRIYKIQLPDQIIAGGEGAVVDRLTVFSETSGDVSRGLTARMGPDGRDRLRITGRLRQVNGLTLTNVTTAVPLRVDYE